MEEIIELLENKQYTRLRQRLEEMNDADIAAVLEELDNEEMLKVFRILPKDAAAGCVCLSGGGRTTVPDYHAF